MLYFIDVSSITSINSRDGFDTAKSIIWSKHEITLAKELKLVLITE